MDMLQIYAQASGERWHMPGHKGRTPVRGDFLCWEFDVTEIGPMDKNPNPVQVSERLMAAVSGADRTWYSVAGATLPVMAAILAANRFESTLRVDRTLHRSVLGALTVGGYQAEWIYPQFVRAGLMLPLREFGADFSGSSGLVLTRPTYDGLAASIQSVIDEAHRQGLTVVVDEAHGSHWSGEWYPESALSMGADLVAHGVHKTEASLTQTGLLHLQGHRIDPSEVDRWWRILGTSSPSYLLLASLDRLQWERHQPHYRDRWQRLAERAESLWNTMTAMGIPVLQPWAKAEGLSVDPARLTLLGPGKELAERLARYGELEKVTPGSATLFLSPDQELSLITEALRGMDFRSAEGALEPLEFPRLNSAMTVREAASRNGRRVGLAESRGLVIKEAVTPYPPGIPVALPGEQMTEAMIDWLKWWAATTTAPIQGLTWQNGRAAIEVVDE